MNTPGSFAMWEQYSNKSEHLVIGIMSGTSLDGIDVALVRIGESSEGTFESAALVGFECMEYTEELRQRIIALCSPETARLDQLVEAHYGISEWYAYAVNRLLQRTCISADQVDVISMHGQTVWHAPVPAAFPGPQQDYAVRSTFQIGDLSVVRERTGIPVIGNLRAADMAAGGEGAPLTPYCDGLLFGSSTEGRIIQNIGGIGNATILPAGAPRESIRAFDTGPGNMVMDALVRLETGGQMNYDPEGRMAAEGQVHRGLLDRYMEDEYYRRQPPKSTGREIYGEDFARRFSEDAAALSMTFADTLATATALTAASIVHAVERWIMPNTPVSRLLTCGGGSWNRTLMSMLERQLPEGIALARTADYGVPDEAREAIAFAIMGHESLMGRVNNLPAVTGAERSVILGMMTL